MNPNGHLCVDRHVDWIPLMRLAENCEDQNAEAGLTPYTGAIVIRTCKEVRAGQELKVWLTHELLSLLEIPFLLPSNILSHQLYRCCQCGSAFTQPNPLKIHMAFSCSGMKGSGERPGSTAATATTAVVPANVSALAVKNQQTAGEVPVTPIRGKDSRLITTKEPKTHVCVFCGKLYTRKYGLKIHLRTHTGHKPLHCRFCGRPFSDPSNLNKHIRLHAHHATQHLPSSPYKCKVCGKIMVRRRDLERHVKSRHEE